MPAPCRPIKALRHGAYAYADFTPVREYLQKNPHKWLSPRVADQQRLETPAGAPQMPQVKRLLSDRWSIQLFFEIKASLPLAGAHKRREHRWKGPHMASPVACDLPKNEHGYIPSRQGGTQGAAATTHK
jgi:hypothetical protein